jgi:signal transduction histidine kinase
MRTADVRAWSVLPRADVAVAVALAGASLLETVVLDQHLTGSRPVTAVAAVGISGAVAFRRRRPELAVAAASAIFVVQAVLDGAAWDESFATLVAGLLIVYSAASKSSLRRGTSLGAAVILANVVCALIRSDDDVIFDLVVVAIVYSASLLAGMAAGTQRTESTELRRVVREVASDTDRQASQAVADERRRIANELHDIVAHGVSLIAVQAAAGQRVLARPDAPAASAVGVLETIERAAQDALDDMRRLLGILRADDAAALEPLPRATDVQAAADAAAASGVPVDLVVDGDLTSLPPGLDLAVFRITQEAVTNIVKHGAGPAAVTVRVDARAVEIDTRNTRRTDGRRLPLPSAQHGLLGMRERVHVDGGTMTVTDDGGVFRLHVRLPAHGGTP